MKAIEDAPEQADETCAWMDAESKFRVRIDLSTPLVPPWTPPPKPPFTLDDLICPEKDLIMYSKESRNDRAFKDKVFMTFSLLIAMGKRFADHGSHGIHEGAMAIFAGRNTRPRSSISSAASSRRGCMQ